jgi:hypothetical protein
MPSRGKRPSRIILQHHVKELAGKPVRCRGTVASKEIQMNSDPRRHDPLDPRDPVADRPGYTDPRYSNQTVVTGGGGRAGLAIAAIVVALLVIGFIAFSGGGDGVDTTPTASTEDSTVIVPGGDGTEPQPQPEAQPAQPAQPAAPETAPPPADQ